MASLTGNDGQVSVGGVALLATRNFSVDTTADTIETSTMGTDVRTYVKGMSSWSGSADVYFDTSETPPALTAGLVGGAAVAVKFYLLQDATNDFVFTGNGIITGYSVKSSMDGLVEATISIQGTGAVAFSATGNVGY